MSSRRRAAIGLSAAGVLIGAFGLAFVIRLIVREWDSISETIAEGDPLLLVASVACGLAGMTWIGLQWGRALRLSGRDRTRQPTPVRFLPWYFVGQLGKYVPGGLWPVLGRSELAVRGGVARSTAYPSVAISLLTTYLGALVLVAVVAPFAVASGAGASRLWVLLLLPVGALCLHPVVLDRMVRLAERLLARGAGFVVPTWGSTVGLIVRHVPAWVGISAATWLVAEALLPEPPILAIFLATPLSWFVGFVAIPVPGGVGVREATFVGVLAGSLGSADAAAVALASRLVFVAVDLLGAGASTLVARWSSGRRSLPEDGDLLAP